MDTKKKAAPVAKKKAAPAAKKKAAPAAKKKAAPVAVDANNLAFQDNKIALDEITEVNRKTFEHCDHVTLRDAAGNTFVYIEPKNNRAEYEIALNELDGQHYLVKLGSNEIE